jgi:hypothetical protein
MSAPTVYTEKTLADFMAAELGKVATLLGYAVGAADAGSYQEAVNEALLWYGVTNVSQATVILKIRAMARVEAWRKAANDLTTSYKFSSPDGSFERQDVYNHALINLDRALVLAAEYDTTGVYAIAVTRSRPVNDPYRYIPDDARTM